MNTNTGKFIATVSVFGRARDAAGNIISRDTHGLPAMWLNVLGGKIPNRQTITGTVAQRMGIPIDENGVIAPGESSGNPNAKRIIYGQWLHQSDHELFGPQITWNMIKDMSHSSPKEIEETCEWLGEPEVFNLERPELPEDYQRKTVQHISPAKMDPLNHSVNQQRSNVVERALADVGPMRSDQDRNPEVLVSPRRDPNNPDNVIK